MEISKMEKEMSELKSAVGEMNNILLKLIENTNLGHSYNTFTLDDIRRILTRETINNPISGSYTFLHEACRLLDYEQVRWAIHEMGASVSTKVAGCFTPLVVAKICEPDDPASYKLIESFLLERGANASEITHLLKPRDSLSSHNEEKTKKSRFSIGGYSLF